MNFNDAQKYLYSLGNEVLAMKLGLENPRKLQQALGNPQENYIKVQVAGTNGKGSTCAFLDSICRSAGISTGLFTSPHLISITERIKINGVEIIEEDFAIYATKVRETTEAKKLYATFFEQITAIALLAFAEKGIEIAILETGLGGRLDATTAANAEIIGITPIDLDHQQYLGETIEEIAAEKAAVIRYEKQKVAVSLQRADAEQVVLERCGDFGISPSRTDFELPSCRLSLLGKHQIENAKLAIRLAEKLREVGFAISVENIVKGLETAVHKGRLEFSHGILFDGSHNPAGARALRDYLQEFAEKPLTLIFGAMQDKDVREIAEILFPLADKLILTKPENPRSASPQDLAKYTKQEVYIAEAVADALEIAGKFPENLTCVTGSLYLVGEAQMILGNSK